MTCCSFTRTRCRALLDKVAGTLALPPTMHLDQLIKIDSPESLLPRLSEQADLMVLGHDHPALSGHTPFGHTTSTVASMSPHPVVAVPRGWTQPADDRRPITVAIDGKHPLAAPSDMPSLRQASARSYYMVVHSAPLSELALGEQDTRLNLAEILAGWKADYPDIAVETFVLPRPPRDTVPSVSDDVQLLVVGGPYRGREWTRWIRSVARAALDRATSPVAVIPHQHPRSATAD
jgi:nucleotide-binding universal stress UspA family protein